MPAPQCKVVLHLEADLSVTCLTEERFVAATSGDDAEMKVVWPEAATTTTSDLSWWDTHAAKVEGVGSVCVTAACLGNTQTDFVPSVERTYRSGLLKSGVQKAVRRRNVHAALSQCIQLFFQDSDSLDQIIRRIPLIAVEDSVPHPQLITLCTWLMIALTRGYDPTTPLLQKILSFFGEVAASPARLCFSESTLERGDPHTSLLALCLTIRKGYGGMGGDMIMLDAAAKYCEVDASFEARCLQYYAALRDDTRFAFLVPEESEPPPTPNDSEQHIPKLIPASTLHKTPPRTIPSILPYRNIPPFPIQDQIPSAVDFHCFRFMTERVLDRCKRYTYDFVTESDIKSLWWKCRSGVYLGKPLLSERDFDDKVSYDIPLDYVEGAAITDEEEDTWGLIHPVICEVTEELSPWRLEAVVPSFEEQQRGARRGAQQSTQKQQQNAAKKRKKDEEAASRQPPITALFRKRGEPPAGDSPGVVVVQPTPKAISPKVRNENTEPCVEEIILETPPLSRTAEVIVLE